jgi:hypothetical protein
MNDRTGDAAQNAKALVRPISRAPYSAPTLRFFGNVAKLTQAATGCDNNDNKACAGINGRQNKN